MANSRTKTNKKPVQSRKTTGTSKTVKSTKPTREEVEKNYKIKYELKMIALASITLFMMLSLYTNAVGVVGHFITNVVLGLFSYVGYGFPIAFFVLFFVHLNPNFRPARKRVTIALSFIMIGLLVASTLFATDAAVDMLKLRSNYLTSEGISMAYTLGGTKESGGILGDTLTIMLLKSIGPVGTYIFIIVALLVGFIIFTRISIQDLWAMRVKASETRKVQKDERRALEEEMLLEMSQNKAVVSTPKKKQTLDPADPGFLSELEMMRKSSRKKEIKNFDYDTYESDEVKPVSDEKKVAVDVPKVAEKPEIQETFEPPVSQVKFYDHSEKKSNEKAAVKPVEKAIEKITEKDIDPQTRQMVHDEIRQNTQLQIEMYELPPLTLLNEEVVSAQTEDKSEYLEMAKLLEETLNNFNVDAKVVSVKRGPSITMFEIQPSPGVKVSKIVGLSDDIALNLATSHVRIAPIPGKVAIGIEVPNKVTSMVTIREVITSADFKKQKSKLTIGLGKDISGNAIIGDLANMPHLLIAGATGSGKSVCVNTIISSILFNARPDEVKFLMIDPKVVELSNYNGIPHLILPVVTDPKKASIALNWAVNEMTRRYKMFAEQVVRDMKSYNKKAEFNGLEMLPQIVVIIDELADLMMVAPNQVEDAICRLAQMARAAGIHLIVATQRPSVDVITGLIKANIPSRIAFSVSSSIDSRTIIDMGGAEKLLGKGDMLYYPIGASKPKRAQGAFMSDEEVEALVGFIKNQNHEVKYNEEILDDVQSFAASTEDVDEYLEEAIQFVVESGQASASLMQRRFRVGYNRAARLVDSMEERGIIGPTRGSKPREVLISPAELRSLNGADEIEPVYEEASFDQEEDI